MIETAHKVMTAVLTAAVLGGASFVIDTRTEIALLQAEIKQVKSMSEQILTIIEAADPRQ